MRQVLLSLYIPVWWFRKPKITWANVCLPERGNRAKPSHWIEWLLLLKYKKGEVIEGKAVRDWRPSKTRWRSNLLQQLNRSTFVEGNCFAEDIRLGGRLRPQCQIIWHSFVALFIPYEFSNGVFVQTHTAFRWGSSCWTNILANERSSSTSLWMEIVGQYFIRWSRAF